VKTATINLTVKIARVGVFKTRVLLTNDQTGELVRIHEKDYAKCSRLSAAKRALAEAQDYAKRLGFDEISQVKSTEKELQIRN
jgi:pantoate kinase